MLRRSKSFQRARSSVSRPPSPLQPSIDDDEELNEIIMAVDLQARGTVGCGYYSAAKETLFAMEDVKSGNIEAVEMLKTSIEPTVLLVSTRASDELLECVNPDGYAGNQEQMSSDSYSLPYALEFRPGSDFGQESALNKLMSLPICSATNEPASSFEPPGTEPDSADEHQDYDGQHERILRLAGWINLESKTTLGCLGAVLAYLQRRRLARFLPGDAAAAHFFRVVSFEIFSLKNTMYINADTLHGLQILGTETHPNSHNQGPNSTGSKEGLSVYGLFHYFACTPQGKYMLRQRFLRPSLDIEVLNDRLDSVATFLSPSNEAVMKPFIKDLRGIVNVRATLARLRRGIAGGSGKGGAVSKAIWSGLRKFVFHAVSIQNRMDSVSGAERMSLYAKMRAMSDVEALNHIGNQINYIIDFEQSTEENRIVVNYGVDEELDESKRFYSGVDDLLSTVARELVKDIPSNIPAELNTIYFPQIGFLVSISRHPENGSILWEGTEEDGWEKMFVTETAAYYKTHEMREMDNRFGDVLSQIHGREIEIVHALAQDILQYEVMLTACSDWCGELDCLLAFAQGARRYNLNRPRLTTTNVLDIRDGRHILHELRVPQFVPNSTYLVGGTSSPQSLPDGPAILLLTGPNFSGKSVHLKSIALSTYLAHIGSFIPAAPGSVVGSTDKLLTRVATRESVSRSHSTFAIDCAQIALALNIMTPRSLLVLDECGKGTTPADGAGLAAGILHHLLGLGRMHCPRVLAATHFHEIFDVPGAVPHADGMLRLAHMQIHLNQNAPTTDGQVVYLYSLQDGRCAKSYGTVCAAMNGIPPAIVRRAERILETQVNGELPPPPPEDRMEREALREAEEIAKRFLGWNSEESPENNIRAVLRDILAPF